MRAKKLFLFFLTMLTCGSLGILFYQYQIQHRTASIAASVPGLHNGDAKFYNNYILTNVQGILSIYDLSGQLVRSFPDITAYWIYCIPEEHLIVYSNANKQLGILQLDGNLNVISNNIVMQTDNYQIDPTLIKVDGVYYMTTTEIEGTVNNANPTAENGLYTLHFYQSENLQDWTLVQDIAKERHNIEDVDLIYHNNKFIITYEREKVDKGDSSIQVSILDNRVRNNVAASYELLTATCDHEPAAIEPTKNGYRLYYSCDKNDPGTSYNGAQIFYADYDENWNPISIDNLVKTETKKGILLYDVTTIGNKQFFVYSQNYLTDANMIIEER